MFTLFLWQGWKKLAGRVGGVVLFFLVALSIAGLASQSVFADCVDSDGDGFGRLGHTDCKSTLVDCNDANSRVFPGAPEVCGNGVDEDCNWFDAACDASCQDGTPEGSCNAELLLCSGGELVERCQSCGCVGDAVCFEGVCQSKKALEEQGIDWSVYDDSVISEGFESSCTPEWECSAWSACVKGVQTRSCTARNDCLVRKPAEQQPCAYEPPKRNTGPLPEPIQQQERSRQDELSSLEDLLNTKQGRGETEETGAEEEEGPSAASLEALLSHKKKEGATSVVEGPERQDPALVSDEASEKENRWDAVFFLLALGAIAVVVGAVVALRILQGGGEHARGGFSLQSKIASYERQGFGRLQLKAALLSEGYTLDEIEDALEKRRSN
ncbi:hypothetical protein D6783_04615 [Candidatus Woesearchaeota archaeon]|nr:MAG: hypothetical protein D6783_04615 [Candidatus Woesearchaeota archaeon]